MDIEKVVNSYIECALWADAPEENMGEFDHTDFSEKDIKKVELVCKDFLEKAKTILEATYFDEGQVGHDLWLTSQGSGEGFWSRGKDCCTLEQGQQLSEIVETVKKLELYIENGKPFFE